MNQLSWKNFRGFYIIGIISVFVYFWLPKEGLRVYRVVWDNILFILGIIPPIFILVGLFDVWVPREKVTHHLGDRSGWRGILISIAIGALTAGPLYVAFPIADVMLREGTILGKIIIFIEACSAKKIRMLLFEVESLGFRFAACR